MARLRSFLIVGGFIGALAGTNEIGKKFLEENKKREGVVTLASGLQYKMIEGGHGLEHPLSYTECEVHYAGTTPTLTPDAVTLDFNKWNTFDSTYKDEEQAFLAPDQVIKGWTEAMQLMVEGDIWELYIPSDLGYGDEGAGRGIDGGDVLIFRLQMIKVMGHSKPTDRCNAVSLKNCDEVAVEWITKHKKMGQEKLKSEVHRYKNMLAKEHEKLAIEWFGARIRWLEQMTAHTEL
eukprot:TRINITY_DN866_c0_g1_i1.p1 TRINITY_DN866_c0_g1~~TRINITY_DN866_c0_g1_i1.p1  ORF type:complete len:235 (+),score=49.74 TRINITY_DN866_c0_g1_i1:99-803(+)